MKKNAFLLLIGLITSFIGLAQPQNPDSLVQLLATPLPDTVRMEVISQLLPYYYLNDLEEGLERAEELQSLAERLQHQPFICESYSYQGQILGRMNADLEQVVPVLEEALECFRAANDSLKIATTLSSIGIVYARKGVHLESLALFQQLLDVSKALNDTALIIRSYINLGGVIKSRLEYAKSLSYSHKGLIYAREFGAPLPIGTLLNNIAYVHFIQGHNDTALVVFEEALPYLEQAGDESSVAITLANIGGVHVAEGRYDLATKFLDRAYPRAIKVNYPFAIGLSLEYMATSAMQQQRYPQAVQRAYEGLAVFGHEGVPDHVRELYAILSESYEGLNRPDSALVYLKSFQTLNDSLFQAEKEMQIQNLEISFEVQQKEIENRLLKSEQSFMQQKLKNQSLFSIGLVVALIMVFIWGLGIYRISQAKKVMNEELETQVAARTEELQLSNNQLKQANYELKTFNYIASHDIKEPIRNISSYVSLIQIRLTPEDREKMELYFNIISQSTHQLYSLIDDFANYTNLSKNSPAAFEEVDMHSLLSKMETSMGTFMQAQNGRLVFDNLPRIWSSPSLISVALKNLIENGIKFNTSPSPTVKVNYLELPDHHQFEVADNGIGIEPGFHEQIFSMFKRLHRKDEYPGTGIGLALVKLVVEKLGGDIQLRSGLDTGSIFTIRLPKVSPATENITAQPQV